MKFALQGTISEDPRDRVLAVEGAVRAICQATGQDPAEGVMMLLTAAAHMQNTYSKPEISMQEKTALLAECLGAAILSADDFFKLRIEPAPQQGKE